MSGAHATSTIVTYDVALVYLPVQQNLKLSQIGVSVKHIVSKTENDRNYGVKYLIMPTAIILIADGSEEIEFVTPYDVLIRAGFDVKSIGVNLKNGTHATCSRNVKIMPDFASIETTELDSGDILILPGGAPGAKTFCDNGHVQDAIRRYRGGGKWVACICAATTALVNSAEKNNTKVKVTSHPSVKEQIISKGWEYSEDRVVTDGKVITSRGPGTALEFSLAIVRALLGESKKEEVAGPMICM